MQHGQDCFGVPSSIKPGVSEIYLEGSNGLGSSATAIRRFTLPALTYTGNDITLVDDPVTGMSFVIKTPGVYAMSHTIDYSSGSQLGISKNSTQLSTAIFSIASANRIAYVEEQGADAMTALSVVTFLNANDVIRAHIQVSPTIGTESAKNTFRITKIA